MRVPLQCVVRFPSHLYSRNFSSYLFASPCSSFFGLLETALLGARSLVTISLWHTPDHVLSLLNQIAKA